MLAVARSVVGMAINELFTQHPASVGESYAQHLRAAAGFGLRMLTAGFACIVHALLPFLFEHTASRCIGQLYKRMVVERSARTLR